MQSVISPSTTSSPYLQSMNSFDEILATSKMDESENPTIEEKRQIIKQRLKNNFPVKTVLAFGMGFIAIGLAAISMDIALITFKAVNYQLGNGLWAGCSSILNGLTKLNQCNSRVI